MDTGVNTVTMPLTKGQVAIVDEVDKDLAAYKWTYSSKGYAYRTRPFLALHRVILERKIQRRLVRGEEADHINGDPLDDRRDNLRAVLSIQNKINRRVNYNSRTGIKGVHLRDGRWSADIRFHKIKYHLGTFNTCEEAVEARKSAERRLHGEYARQ